MKNSNRILKGLHPYLFRHLAGHHFSAQGSLPYFLSLSLPLFVSLPRPSFIPKIDLDGQVSVLLYLLFIGFWVFLFFILGSTTLRAYPVEGRNRLLLHFDPSLLSLFLPTSPQPWWWVVIHHLHVCMLTTNTSANFSLP